jgi:membrane protein DedA with SNARE-associated domain
MVVTSPATAPLAPGVLAAASDPDQLTGLIGWIADVIAALGSVGVAVLTLAEVFFPPIPSELVLPMAGYLASQDRLNLVASVIAATIGSTLGALALYWVGYKLGVDRVAALLRRIPLMDEEDLDRARGWFDRHDRSSVLIGRLVPGVRSLISLPAGFQEMPLLAFTALTAAGSIVWNAALVAAGYLLGRQWQSVGRYSDWLNFAVIGVLAAGIVKFVWGRRARITAGRD